jgi:hypothetical protein
MLPGTEVGDKRPSSPEKQPVFDLWLKKFSSAALVSIQLKT